MRCRSPTSEGIGRCTRIWPPSARSSPPDVVARAAELEIELNVWTVNDPAEIRRLASVGVDGIITDTPRLARQALGRE